jgi:phosphoadenosine phosphosulfate reductase
MTFIALLATDTTDYEKESDEETLAASVTLSRTSTPVFTQDSLDALNQRLETLSPQQVLKWALDTFCLWQTTSFGLTGCVIVHLLAKVNQEDDYSTRLLKRQGKSIPTTKTFETRHDGRGTSPVPIIFIDTLHHFPETIQLSKDVAVLYNADLKVYTPLNSSTQEDFTKNYGKELWLRDADSYDFLVKSEPAQRAYSELGVVAVLTGRRRSQRGSRSALPIVEVDSTGLIKINPLASWTYEQTWEYIQANDVPYNPLVDHGYKSIGDVHSTQPVKEGEGERDGRWKGMAKTECGLHKDYFEMEKRFKQQLSV